MNSARYMRNAAGKWCSNALSFRGRDPLKPFDPSGTVVKSQLIATPHSFSNSGSALKPCTRLNASSAHVLMAIGCLPHSVLHVFSVPVPGVSRESTNQPPSLIRVKIWICGLKRHFNPSQTGWGRARGQSQWQCSRTSAAAEGHRGADQAAVQGPRATKEYQRVDVLECSVKIGIP